MNKLLILLSLMTGAAIWQPEDTKVVTGYILSPGGDPLVGATVMVTGTQLGAMSGVNGYYIIEDVPVANLQFRCSMVGTGESTLRPEITSEDTLHVDFELAHYGEEYTFSMERMQSNFHPSEPLEIQIDNWQGLDLNLNQIWYKEHLIQGKAVNDSTLMAYLPYYADEFFLTVFNAFETLVPLDVNSRTVNVTLNRNPILLDVKLPKTIPAEYSHIDLTKWGNSNFLNWGLIGVETAWSENGIPRILIVYHDQAVLINEQDKTTVVPFPFPTMHYQSDSCLNQLLIWDIHGQNANSGNAAVISLEEGTYSVFDPTPVIEEPEQNILHYGGAFITTPHYYGPIYLLSSSGEVVRLGKDFMRFYDSSGTQTARILYETFGVESLLPVYLFPSLNETAFSAVFSDGTFYYCTTVSLNGNVLHLSRLPVDLFPISRTDHFLNDPSQAAVWGELNSARLLRFDCLTGEYIDLDHRSDRMFAGTYPGVFHSWNSCPNEDSSLVETIDWNTGEVLESSTQAKEGTFDARVRGLSILSGNPATLGISRVPRDSLGNIYAYLLNNSGEPVWLSPPLHNTSRILPSYSPRRLSDFTAVQSPYGSFAVLPNGRYLVIAEFDLTGL